MWQGSIATVPDKWKLCDGTFGTPDLRDKFVLAAGLSYIVDETGGNDLHDHTLTTDGHTHTLSGGSGITGYHINSSTTNVSTDTATTTENSAKPPWYSIAFIMFVGW